MDAITVTMNSGTQLQKLLSCEAVRESFHHLIVVDNASSDGSVELAREAGARVIALKERAPYSACVNLGVSKTFGPLFAVMNPDILFPSTDVVPRLMEHFADPRVALAAPALRLPDGTIQDSARDIPTPLDLVLRRRLRPRLGMVKQAGDVPWVVGACFLARRRAWRHVGGLDESFRLYFEDVDLGWRLHQQGWVTRYDPFVVVAHEHGRASRRSLIGEATRCHIESAARFYRSNPRFLVSRQLPAAPAMPLPARLRPVPDVPLPAADRMADGVAAVQV